MSYRINVTGAFRISPPADAEQVTRVAQADRGWRVSPNGQLLYLPSEEHPDPFEAIRYLAERLLPELGLSVEGSVTWIGEDETEGSIQIHANRVTVLSPEPEELNDQEIERLIEQLKTGTEEQRVEAAEIFEAFQASSGPVVAALAAALKSDAAIKVRLRAASTLSSFGKASLPALDALVSVLDDKEPWVQAAAAEVLGAIGPGASAAVPILQRLRAHPSYGVAGRAKEALARITGIKHELG